MKILNNKVLFLFLILLAVLISVFLHFRHTKKMNVVLITLDCLRSDHLGCYGYKRNTSPNIDKFASEGVLFTRAIAQGTRTVPTMGSIVTSTLPRTHLLMEWEDMMNPKLSSLAEILKGKGYKTIFVIGNSKMGDGEFQDKALREISKGFNYLYHNNDATIATNKAIDYVYKYSKNHFFIWIHYLNTHTPYADYIPYDKLFVNDGLYYNPYIKNQNDEEVIKHLDYIAKYDRAIRTVDAEIDRIMESLILNKLDKNTLIIISADHGEMFGEHGWYFVHGSTLYEPLLRVPLIIIFKNIISQKKVIDSQISVDLDIAPTILDILGIKKPKTMQGHSLLGVITGKEEYPLEYIFSDERTTKSVKYGDWKLIYNETKNEDKYELYNLASDLTESNNLVNLNKDIFERLKYKIDEYLRSGPKSKGRKRLLDDKTKEELRYLGYVQ